MNSKNLITLVIFSSLFLLPLANATRLLNIQQIQNSGNIFIEAAVVGT